MPVLTNYTDHCNLLNLGSAPGGKGPYALRQSGYPPGSMNLQEDPYFLRKDGVWVLNIAMFTLPEKEIREKFLFQDITELLKAIDEVAAKPVVAESKLPAGKSRSEILAALQTAASTLISKIRDAKASALHH